MGGGVREHCLALFTRVYGESAVVRCSSVLADDREHNDEHDLPKPVQEEERHAGVAHLAEDCAEARNRPPTPRTNPTQSLLVARGEHRVTNEPVLTLELLLEVAGRTPFPTRQANYEYERPGRVICATS